MGTLRSYLDREVGLGGTTHRRTNQTKPNNALHPRTLEMLCTLSPKIQVPTFKFSREVSLLLQTDLRSHFVRTGDTILCNTDIIRKTETHLGSPSNRTATEIHGMGLTHTSHQ